MSVVAFRREEVEQGDPMVLAVDHVRVAVVDFAVAIEHATTPEAAKAIRKQIEARVLELEAMGYQALDREIALERGDE